MAPETRPATAQSYTEGPTAEMLPRPVDTTISARHTPGAPTAQQMTTYRPITAQQMTTYRPVTVQQMAGWSR
jgi:hypothetical protein